MNISDILSILPSLVDQLLAVLSFQKATSFPVKNQPMCIYNSVVFINMQPDYPPVHYYMTPLIARYPLLWSSGALQYIICSNIQPTPKLFLLL